MVTPGYLDARVFILYGELISTQRFGGQHRPRPCSRARLGWPNKHLKGVRCPETPSSSSHPHYSWECRCREVIVRAREGSASAAGQRRERVRKVHSQAAPAWGLCLLRVVAAAYIVSLVKSCVAWRVTGVGMMPWRVVNMRGCWMHDPRKVRKIDDAD